MHKKILGLCLSMVLVFSLVAFPAVTASGETITFDDPTDASLFASKDYKDDISYLLSEYGKSMAAAGGWSITNEKLTLYPYCGDNLNASDTTQVPDSYTYINGGPGGYNSLSPVVGLTTDPGLIEEFSFTTQLGTAAHQSLLVITSYTNGAVYDAVAVSGVTQMRKYTRTLSENTLTVTQYENASGVQLYTDGDCTTKATDALSGEVTVTAKFQIIDGGAYYVFTVTRGTENRYFRCPVGEMLTNVYFSITRATSVTVDDLDYTVFGGFESGTVLTEAQAQVYYTMATKYPQYFTDADMEKIYDALGISVEDVYFYDDFSTADNWECLNPFAHQEKNVNAGTLATVNNGQLQINRLANNMYYGYIYALKDSSYDGSPIYKASFKVTININSTNDVGKGFALITDFEDINNFHAITLGNYYGGTGYRGSYTRKNGVFPTKSDNAWFFLDRDKVAATIADDDKLSNNGGTASAFTGFESGVTVTMEWDAVKGHYIISFDLTGGKTYYMKGGDKLLTNLYFSNFDNSNAAYVDDVKIYKNDTYAPVYRYTQMSTIASGNTQFQYTVSQNGVKDYVSGLSGATEIAYGFTYIYRSATVENMQTLAGKENYFKEVPVENVSEIPETYAVKVKYSDENPGRRVTVLPYVRYTPEGGGEPVYLWATECASVSPAGYLKEMLSKVVGNSFASIQYNNEYTLLNGKITGNESLYTAIAASANQSEALAAMNANGYTDATVTEYFALLAGLFS